MTSPDRLLSAIRAALDETERLARDAVADNATGHWHIAGQQGFLHEAVTDRTGLRLATGASFVQRHIARHDPDTVLRWVTATREIVTEVESWRHRVCEDSWYSCSQATEDNGYPADLACADEGRAGSPCDCGLDARKLRILSPLARGLGIDPEETP